MKKPTERQLVLKTGTPAYLDTFAGPVRCKVVSITRGEHGTYNVTAIVTSISVAAYPKGTRVKMLSRYVVPRGAIYQRNGQFRIMPYSVEVDS